MLYTQVDTIKIQMFGTEEFVVSLTDVPRRCRESSSSVKYPGTFLTPPFSAHQPSHVYDLPLTSRRRPKNKRRRDDGRHSQPWRVAPTTTALTQQSTPDSDRASVDLPRDLRAIDRRHRTVDCCMVAFVILYYSWDIVAAESTHLGSSAAR
jgi:hypothetical protein